MYQFRARPPDMDHTALNTLTPPTSGIYIWKHCIHSGRNQITCASKLKKAFPNFNVHWNIQDIFISAKLVTFLNFSANLLLPFLMANIVIQNPIYQQCIYLGKRFSKNCSSV